MTVTKKFTAILIAMIALFSSCTQNDIYEEYYNVSSFSRDYKVLKASWKEARDDSGYYLYYEFTETNLTQFIYDNGIMQAFLLMEGKNITPLPFDDFWIDKETGYMWTEQVTCEFRPGVITFILKYNDHATEILPYYDYTFRVRFLW